MWFELKGDERVTQRCATDGCGGQPTFRFEGEGIGSNYCSGCRADIERVTSIFERDKRDNLLMDEIEANLTSEEPSQ